jgi:hypothetical protein
MKVPAVLKNKYLFYALAVLAALNVIGYASVKAYECLALFLLAGYGMHCYCSNKSLSILAALFVANFVFGCGRVKEGFEEAMKAPADLLKDAANAAAEAGGQLAREGNTSGVAKCSDLAITAATVSADCENDNYTKSGEAADPRVESNKCEFTKAIEAKCMNNGVKVEAADAAACKALGIEHKYEEATAATCA